MEQLALDLDTDKEQLAIEIFTAIDSWMTLSGMNNTPEVSVTNQWKQFKEELFADNELMDSIRTKDLIGTLDGLGDVGFVAISLQLLSDKVDSEQANAYAIRAKFFYFNILKIFDLEQSKVNLLIQEVTNSNLSKFDITEKDANATKAHYESLGIKVGVFYSEGTGRYYVTSLANQSDNKGKGYHEGKVLKSVVNFKEPDFTKLLPMFSDIQF